MERSYKQLKALLIAIIAISISVGAYAQTPNRSSVNIYWGDLSISKRGDSIPDPSTTMDIGLYGGKKAVLFRPFYKDSVASPEDGMFGYDITADRPVIHSSGSWSIIDIDTANEIQTPTLTNEDDTLKIELTGTGASSTTPLPYVHNNILINGHPVTENVDITKTDIGLSNVPNIDATVAENIIQDSAHRFISDDEKDFWNDSLNTWPTKSFVNILLTGKIDTGTTGAYVYTESQLLASFNARKKLIIVDAPFLVTSNIRIPDSTTLIGTSKANARLTQGPGNSSGVLYIKNGKGIHVSGLDLTGTFPNVDINGTSIISNPLQIVTNTNIGSGIGLDVDSCDGCSFKDIDFHNFGYAGMHVKRVGATIGSIFGITANNLNFDNCYHPLYLDSFAEYSIYNNIKARFCVTALTKYSGNVIINNYIGTDDILGYVDIGGASILNAGHGVTGNIEFNHCVQASAYIYGISAGETISNCAFFNGGPIYVVNSAAINFNGVTAQCSWVFDGGGWNSVINSTFGSGNGSGTFSILNNAKVKKRGNTYGSTATSNQGVNDVPQIYLPDNTVKILNAVEVDARGVGNTGCMSFSHPSVNTSGGTMPHFTIPYYFYNGASRAGTGTLYIDFYQNTQTSTSNAGWNAYTVTSDGATPINKVQIGIDSLGYINVLLGDTNTVWPTTMNVDVDKIKITTNGASNLSWQNEPWSKRFVTTLANFTQLKTIPLVSITPTASGTSTQSGNGSTTVFNIAHGMSSAPFAGKVKVTPKNAASAGNFYITTNTTNIIVNYVTAPASGTNNLSWDWSAQY